MWMQLLWQPGQGQAEVPGSLPSDPHCHQSQLPSQGAPGVDRECSEELETEEPEMPGPSTRLELRMPHPPVILPAAPPTNSAGKV